MTQFEALTAAAYHELARRGVEVAVIEAGLGGRYDATNVIPSEVQVLTSVGLEHTRWLGPTIADIAEEKLAVVRDHATLVTGPLTRRRPVAREVAERATPAAVAGAEERPLRARGGFQRRNFAVAAAAAEAFLGDRRSTEAAVDGAARRRGAGPHAGGRRGPADHPRRRPQPRGAGALAEALEGRAARRRRRDPRRQGRAGCCGPAAAVRERRLHRRANPRSLSPGHAGVALHRSSAARRPRSSPTRAALERARELAGPDGAVLATGRST